MARLACLVAARPNFVKMAPLLEALSDNPRHEALLVHTGQHYDRTLSEAFFLDLELPEPAFHLGVGSGSHAFQTGRTMEAFEKLIVAERFDGVVVAGDVNATLAGALVAAKECKPLVHVESGLRSFDRTMPEEVNRVVTDQLADLCLTTTRGAGINLEAEGIPRERIRFVGNTMIDSLDKHIGKARSREVARAFGLGRREYAVLTLHRPSNVDDPASLGALIDAVASAALPTIFPVHPRTRDQMTAFGIELGTVNAVEPLGYVDFISLLDSARLVITDSGGLQEETTVLGIPCITVRENTERPETVTEGSNLLVGKDPKRITDTVSEILAAPMPEPHRPERWDGKAGPRAAEAIDEIF